jgi:hypothetical protein
MDEPLNAAKPSVPAMARVPAGQLMSEIGAAERDGEEEAQRRSLAIHLRWLRALCELEAAKVVAGRRVGRAGEKAGEGFKLPDIVPLCSLKIRIVMSVIMRRRRSLIGLSLIAGPVLRLECWIPRPWGRDRSRHSLSISW